MKKRSNHRLYILMRNDLPSLNPGKGMAHAAHAANQFTFEYPKHPRVKEWQRDANGFGTTICLSANKVQLEEVVKAAKKKGWPAGLVYDPEYGYSLHEEIAQLIDRRTFTADAIINEDGRWVLFRNELTCGYLFIADDSPDREMLVSDLPLHP